MKHTRNKIWNVVSTVIVVLIVALAIALVGVRLFGIKAYCVTSGSMVPTYQVGSLVYVKSVDPEDLEVGDVISFMLDEDTVATHRIVEIVPDDEDESVIRFRTKGDANDSPDGSLVHCNNVIGKVVFSIPFVGYIANFVQHPPGTYVAIGVVVILLALVFVPDIIGKDDDTDGSTRKRKKSRARR